jgi:hypothetical protein
MRAFIVLIAAVFGLTACSAMDQLKEKRDDKRDNEGEEVTETSGSGDEETPANPNAAFGLGDGCKFEDGCFICEPRELPVEACVPGELPAGFDPATACQREEKKLTCDLGEGEPFVFDFSEKNKDEKLFDRLPGLLAGVQLFMGVELKDKPEQLATLTAALEILAKHKKALFTATDVNAAVDEAVALAKEKKPDLKDAEIADMKAKLLEAIAAWKVQKKKGAGDGDILAMATGMLGSLPPGLADKLPKIDMSTLMDKLKGAGAGGVDLGAIMKILPGGDLSGILTILGGAKEDDANDDDDDEAATDEEE